MSACRETQNLFSRYGRAAVLRHMRSHVWPEHMLRDTFGPLRCKVVGHSPKDVGCAEWRQIIAPKALSTVTNRRSIVKGFYQLSSIELAELIEQLGFSMTCGDDSRIKFSNIAREVLEKHKIDIKSFDLAMQEVSKMVVEKNA